jgi:HEPN domain-containing protein
VFTIEINTNKDMIMFARENQKAMLMIMNATTDYASARCLLLNGLFPGLVLGAQAVEKYLKGSILFLDKNKDTRKLSHGLVDLKNELQKLSGLHLEKFNPFLERLEKHYLTRYPDNKDSSKSMSTGEIREIDELIIFLNESLSVRNEIKFRSGLYVQIFDESSAGRSKNVWLTKSNLALNNIYSRLHAEYKVVYEKLYSQKS